MQLSNRFTRPSVRTQRPSARRSLNVACQAGQRQAGCQLGRRDAMVAAGVLLTGTQLAFIPLPAMADVDPKVKSLNGFQKKDQREAFTATASAVVKEMVTEEDAADTLRLGLRSAATYDAVSQTGGFNGAIFLSAEEQSRPENASLLPVIEKLKKVKVALDAAVGAQGFPPISYSDLLVLACRESHLMKWARIKTEEGNRDSIDAYGAPWPVILGRVDSATPGDKHLPADNAPVEEIRAALNTVAENPNEKKGLFSAKPMLWEKPGFLVWCSAAKDMDAEEARFAAADPVYEGVKKEYTQSRRTVTRTNYEVDLINMFTRLSYLGAKFDPDANLHA